MKQNDAAIIPYLSDDDAGDQVLQVVNNYAQTRDVLEGFMPCIRLLRVFTIARWPVLRKKNRQ